jgi:thioredoxin-like negative regulator of GroEL
MFESTTVGEAARREAVDTAGAARPRLLFFFSSTSGRSRRVEGFLAQVLQKRKNHDTFEIVRVDVGERSDVAERLLVTGTTELIVFEEGCIRGRLVEPRGCASIEELLSPWLR